MLLAAFSYTFLKHFGWWILAGALGALLGWLLKSCFKPKPVTITDAQGIARYETRVNELTSLRAKDLDQMDMMRKRVAELEATPPKIVEKPVEKIVEKTIEVESPVLLARVRDLEGQANSYQTQILGFQTAPPKVVEKVVTVEKIVEKPVEKIVTIEKIVEVESLTLQNQIRSLTAESETSSNTYVTRIRELESEAGKVSGLQTRVRDLETEAGQVAGLRTRIHGLEGQVNDVALLRSRVSELEAAPPKLIERTIEVEKIVEKPVDRVIEIERVVELDSPALVAAAGHLRAQVADLEPRVGRIAGLEARIRELEAAVSADTLDVSGARGVLGFDLAVDDLKVVEGVGPKIEEVLHRNGIRTWRRLARTEYSTMRRVLDEGGPQFRIADPTTWPQQAALLDSGNWAAFKVLTDELIAGRRGDANGANAAVITLVEVPFDASAAQAAFGEKITKDDLKVVEGIGPKIEELFHAAGIKSWRELSQSDPGRLREILVEAGSRFQMHDPSTWPRQAALAAEGKWAELKTLTDELNSGTE